jgi:hypothetical protein
MKMLSTIAGTIIVMTCLPVLADPVPFSCTVLPDGESASLMLTNPFDHEASCLATCQFSTAKYDIRPQITCTKPVPAGKEVQMCILKSPGEKLVALMNSSGDCSK